MSGIYGLVSGVTFGEYRDATWYRSYTDSCKLIGAEVGRVPGASSCCGHAVFVTMYVTLESYFECHGSFLPILKIRSLTSISCSGIDKR